MRRKVFMLLAVFLAIAGNAWGNDEGYTWDTETQTLTVTDLESLPSPVPYKEEVKVFIVKENAGEEIPAGIFSVNSIYDTQLEKVVIEDGVETIGASAFDFCQYLKEVTLPSTLKVIEEGGVVFGAKFDKDWSVIHEFTETLAGLTAFRGSKYVQSRIGSSFLLVKEFLEKSRLVLFIGTPCQVRALYLFLRQRYSNLLTIDLVCHGIGSPKVWRLYLEQYYSKDIIRSIAHRDKTLGWERYCLRVSYLHHGKKLVRCEDLRKNPYLRGFIHNIFLRPSCSNCPSKGFKSGSDFTCADFWGIKTIAPNIYDKDGVSLLMVNNERAELFFNKLNISSFPMDYGSAYKYNPSIIASAPIHHFRHLFFLMLGKINFKALVFFIQGINKLHRMMFKAKKV